MPFYAATPFPFQITDPDTGALASGYTLYAFIAGTSTPTQMYSDVSGTSIGTSSVVNSAGYLTSDGSTPINLYLSQTVEYKFILEDEEGVTQWTFDNIPAVVLAPDTPSFDTMQDLRVAATSDVNFVTVGGHTTIADGGQGIFYLDRTDTASVDNDGTIIVDATVPRVGTWKRLLEDQKTRMAWFGVRPNETWDEAAAIAALNWGLTNFRSVFQFESGVYTNYVLNNYVVPTVTDQQGDPSCTSLTFQGVPNETWFFTNQSIIDRPTPRLFISPPDLQFGTGEWDLTFNDIAFDYPDAGSNRPDIMSLNRGRHIIFNRCHFRYMRNLIALGGVTYTNNGNIEFNDCSTRSISWLIGPRKNTTGSKNSSYTLKLNNWQRMDTIGGAIIMDDSSTVGTLPCLNIEMDGVYSYAGGGTLIDYSWSASTEQPNVSLRNMYNYSTTAVELIENDILSGNPFDSTYFTVYNLIGRYEYTLRRYGHVNLEKMDGGTSGSLQIYNCMFSTIEDSYIFSLTVQDCETVDFNRCRIAGLALEDRVSNPSLGNDRLTFRNTEFLNPYTGWGSESLNGWVQYWGSESSTSGGNQVQSWEGWFTSTGASYNLPTGWSINNVATGTYELTFATAFGAVSDYAAHFFCETDNVDVAGQTKNVGSIVVRSRTHNSDTFTNADMSFRITALAGENTA